MGIYLNGKKISGGGANLNPSGIEIIWDVTAAPLPDNVPMNYDRTNNKYYLVPISGLYTLYIRSITTTKNTSVDIRINGFTVKGVSRLPAANGSLFLYVYQYFFLAEGAKLTIAPHGTDLTASDYDRFQLRRLLQ